MSVKTRIAGGVAALVAAGIVAAAGSASSPQLVQLTGVPAANARVAGFAPANVLSPELQETPVAQGATPLENGTAAVPYYGYDGNGPMLPAFGSNVEASKTEPDKNTYLVLDGHHYLFQGHETGTIGYITRIDLDTHAISLLGTTDVSSNPLPVYDGSTWDPWAQRLLLTAEIKSPGGGVWQSTTNAPAQIQRLPALGSGGYEGIQNDSRGNLYIVEDQGGKAGTTNTHAKQPNSFVYRFVPLDPTDLTRGGKLQALQVTGQDGQPIVFHDGQMDSDILAPAQHDLNTYGLSFATTWVTIHDTATDGFAPYDANLAAKTHNATPLKRPENGQFKPGSKFTQFYFDATGDTNALSEANAGYGGWGAVYKLVQDPSSDGGTLSLFYRSDQAHSGFDNVAFLSDDLISFVEDAGDLLHSQRNALDSGYVLDTGVDYGAAGAPSPLRWIAEGRDASATIDAGLAGSPGFQNEGDNEITGIHVSDGDPSTGGILGAKTPKPFDPNGAWRFFFTQQHGDNVTYEVTRH